MSIGFLYTNTCQRMAKETHESKLALEVESGKQIPILQGKVAANRFLEARMNSILGISFSNFEYLGEEETRLADYSDDAIREAADSVAVFKASEEYEQFKAACDLNIEEKKEWLATCGDNANDLHHTKTYILTVRTVWSFADAIVSEYNRRLAIAENDAKVKGLPLDFGSDNGSDGDEEDEEV